MDNLKETAIKALTKFIDTLEKKKAKLFSYWLKDYVKFLEFEKQFNPMSLKKYKRGEIIKAHLGFNIGSEEGGLHYCVVIENNNPINSPVITVIPLTSLKENKDISKLYKSELYLGNELYNSLYLKTSTQLKYLDEIIKNNPPNNEDELEELAKKVIRVKQQHDELSKMKYGSIAMVGQITTISKIRIYNPKRGDDILSNVKISNISLNAIDAKIKELYTKC